ncbi:MAG: hypothetical protein AB8U26_00385 [Rickettsiales endosymbiont of Dermacentor nuttalli]
MPYFTSTNRNFDLDLITKITHYSTAKEVDYNTNSSIVKTAYKLYNNRKAANNPCKIL